MEAIIPTEIGVPTLRTEILEKANTEAIAKDLDMTDKLYDVSASHIASYQQRIANLYNRHVKQRAFRARYLVLRKAFENTIDLEATKF